MTANTSYDPASVRPPAHAGRFYTADPEELRREVCEYLAEAPPSEGPVPKALIAPHAGYVYSGPVAASAYARLVAARDRITKVVLVGPSHHAHLRGVATSGLAAFATPLGLVPLDREGIRLATALHGVAVAEGPHAAEHSLEVQLPFLQVVLSRFEVVPLLVGEATDADIARLLDWFWGGPETCFVVSSDLSHYHDYATAQQLDHATAHAIERLEGKTLDGHAACGYEGVRGLLRAARDHGMDCRTVDLRNSGDTAGPRSRVVGYGAFVLTEAGV